MDEAGLDQRLIALGVDEDGFAAARAEAEAALVLSEPESESSRTETGATATMTPQQAAALTAEDWAKRISKEGYDLTVRWETGGRGYYNTVCRRPSWPGVSSGVTIGFGYDLGYHTRDEFNRHWRDFLPSAAFERLLPSIGVRGQAAKSLCPPLRDIEIEWETAEQVFGRSTLPKYAALVYTHLPNVDRLHPDAVGALFSLVFNRGPSFRKGGDRYREMREIHEFMRINAFDSIPGALRRMARIWPKVPSLGRRRGEEADLFAAGLSKPMVVADGGAQPGASEPPFVIRPGAHVTQTYHELEPERAGAVVDDMVDVEGEERFFASLETETLRENTALNWARHDRSPEYRSFDESLAGQPFRFTPEALELILSANGFEPTRQFERIVFALRGARLTDASGRVDDLRQVDVAAIRAIETRPNHFDFRCIVGVYDTHTKRLSGFLGSTVPNVYNVSRQVGQSSNMANCLPTGVYEYVVGAHTRGNGSRVEGALLQGTSFAKRLDVTTLRSRNNKTFEIDDVWTLTGPINDNIHPSLSQDLRRFSSAGCITLRGQFSRNAHTSGSEGEFGAFRAAMGFGTPEDYASGKRVYREFDGRRYDLVLITGLEAAIASSLVASGGAVDPAIAHEKLCRLRHGSRGPHVERLQNILGLPRTGRFEAREKRGLVDMQMAKLGWADGYLGPEMAKALDIAIFTSAPAGADGPVASDSPPVIGGFSVASMAERGSPDREAALLREIGWRTHIAQTNPEALTHPGIGMRESASPEFMADMLGYGRTIFRRIETQVHAVMCGDDPRDQADRAKLVEVLSGEADARARTLAGLIVGLLPIPSLIAMPVAELISDRLLKPVMNEMGEYVEPQIGQVCAVWSKRIYVDPTSQQQA